MSVEPMSCNRRSFLKGSLVAASGLALGALAGCGNAPTKSQAATVSGNAAASTDLPDSISMADIENSAVELEPVTDFAAEEIYDIVVVGAGCAGVPAVLTALEEGASVCCLQKEPAVSANGAGASCVAHKYSDPGPPSAADPQPVLRRPRVFGHAASFA